MFFLNERGKLFSGLNQAFWRCSEVGGDSPSRKHGGLSGCKEEVHQLVDYELVSEDVR